MHQGICYTVRYLVNLKLYIYMYVYFFLIFRCGRCIRNPKLYFYHHYSELGTQVIVVSRPKNWRDVRNSKWMTLWEHTSTHTVLSSVTLLTYEYTHSAVICYSFNIRVHTQCCHLLLFCLCQNGQPFITAFYYLCSGSRAIFDLLWENIKFSVCFPRTAEMRAFYALHFREHFLQNLHTRYLNIIILKNILRIVDKKGKAADG